MESIPFFETTDKQQRLTFFADVILPVPIPSTFTYRVPYEMNDQIKVGARVVVQFGNRRVLTALVAKLHQTAPSNYQAKYILELLDEHPLVNTHQLALFQWMAEYYMCTVGEVMNAALPSGLKLSSESRIQANPDFGLERLAELTDKEKTLYNALRQQDSLTYEEAARVLEVKNIYHILKGLIDKQAVILYELVREKYKPKTVRRVKLARPYAVSKDKLQALFEKLERSPKQLDVLLKYLQHVPVLQDYLANENGLDKKTLLATEASASSLQTLVKTEVFEEFDVTVSRFEEYGKFKTNKEINLTESQTVARDEILRHFEQKEVVMLHGITGSGKTEVYIELIKRVLENGNQALFLLPEIALTTQIVGRLQKVFGDKMGVYHSKFSDNERVEVWRGVVTGQYSFIIGVRSSIFLPFDNLGLIIVDEEHETSYKQHEPAPRYNGRDVALVLGMFHKSKTLLGSATPSIETYYQAKTGKWGLVKMTKRFGDAQLPDIRLVNLKHERKLKTMRSEFSSALLAELKANIDNKEQSILFQNRRGYSPYLSCEACNWVPRCENCDVSLTYHMSTYELRCHYCGHTEAVPTSCIACGSTKMRSMGFGTEKIEDELKNILPELRVQRMDLDTTRKKYSYQQIIAEFEAQNIDVLVGTQMVSKGLDFDHVSLVGIFDVDRMLHFPDFRSHERTFQMVTQVSGRAGRRDKQGRVLIQTASPEQPILQRIVNGDYEGLYQHEIYEREKFDYPPFTRLIKVTVKHENQERAKQVAVILAANLVKSLGTERVLGPEAPVIERIRGLFLIDILIKLEREKVNMKAVKTFIRSEIQILEADKAYKDVHFVADVDPV